MGELIERSFEFYSRRPCVGYRKKTSEAPSFEEQYTWLTFQQLHYLSHQFGNGLRTYLGTSERAFIGICSLNRIEWIVSDFGASMKGMIVVPIHHYLTEETISMIIDNTKLECVVCSQELLPKFEKFSSKCPSLKHIVVFPDQLGGTFEKLVESSSESTKPEHFCEEKPQFKVSFERVLKEGKRSPLKNHVVKLKPEDIYTIIFSSGSSGIAKGAVFTDKTVKHTVAHQLRTTFDPLVQISKDSLAYVSVCIFLEMIEEKNSKLRKIKDRETVLATFFKGGRTGIASNGITNIFEDLQILNPNTLAATPKFWNFLYSEHARLLSQMRSENKEESSKIIEKMADENIKTKLGKRLAYIAIGGAMSNDEVKRFLKRVFGFEPSDGYGTTESGAIANESGRIYAGVEYKIVSVPDLGYFEYDTPPRGELWVKPKHGVSEYYNNTKETSKAFQEGWFNTGDIVELVSKDTIKIIDRSSSFFKLSQGVFVTPQKLETIYCHSPLISQIFITCADVRKFQPNNVTAVIVPTETALQTHKDEQELQNKVFSTFSTLKNISSSLKLAFFKDFRVNEGDWKSTKIAGVRNSFSNIFGKGAF